jgi:hypothetical protein
VLQSRAAYWLDGGLVTKSACANVAYRGRGIGQLTLAKAKNQKLLPV